MQVIEIPCAPLSRKILLTQHGPEEPLYLGRRDLLYRQLCYRHPGRPAHDRYQQVLTTSIRIELHRHLAERIQVALEDVGYHLYQLHKDMMFTWVAGKVSVNGDSRGVSVQQKAAIRDFLDTHHVEEDDFLLDTACRIWQRWRESRGTNTPQNVPHLSPGLCVRLNAQQSIVAAEKIAGLAPVYCDSFYKHTIQVFRAYIMCHYAKKTVRQTALELHRDFRRVHRSVQRAEIALNNYPKLREVIDYAILSTLIEED